MIDLDKLCGAPAAGLALEQLREQCTAYDVALGPSGWKIAATIIGALGLGALLLIRRIQQGEDAATITGNTIEALLNGGLSVWAGSSAGVILALLLPPTFLSTLLLVFAVLAVLIMIAALINGTGGGIKAAGVLCLLALVGALVLPAVTGYLVPGRGAAGDSYETHVVVTSIVFAVTGFTGALIVTLFRGYHWAVGWLLVPLNASWGALGNLLGLMNHFACLLFYSNHGDVYQTRTFYVRYDAGFHLKANYDFTEGDAMSGNGVVPHERVHVLQHFIFGPIYPLSHAAWMAVMFLPGLILGATKRSNAGAGITDLTYYNNPWEVIAYAFAGRRNDGNTQLIFNDIAAWILTILWIGGATGALIAFLAVRHG